MTDKELKDAVDLVHEYGCIKAIGMGEEDTELINAFQTLIDLGKLYLTIAGMEGMPKEEKKVGMLPLDVVINEHNKTRQKCILAFAKREQELKEGLLSVEDIKDILFSLYPRSYGDDGECQLKPDSDLDYIDGNKIAQAIRERLKKGIK